MAAPEGMTSEEFFRIKSEAAKRASETKRRGSECNRIMIRAVQVFVRKRREEGGDAARDAAGETAAIAAFKQAITKAAMARSTDIVVKRRRGGIVFETFVGAEDLSAAAAAALGEGWDR